MFCLTSTQVWEVKQTDECTVKLRKMFDVVYNIDDEPMVIVADSSHCVQVRKLSLPLKAVGNCASFPCPMIIKEYLVS